MAAQPTTKPQDALTIERPEQLKALGHPLRLKVLQVLSDADEPLTNRELAVRLGDDAVGAGRRAPPPPPLSPRGGAGAGGGARAAGGRGGGGGKSRTAPSRST